MDFIRYITPILENNFGDDFFYIKPSNNNRHDDPSFRCYEVYVHIPEQLVIASNRDSSYTNESIIYNLIVKFSIMTSGEFDDDDKDCTININHIKAYNLDFTYKNIISRYIHPNIHSNIIIDNLEILLKNDENRLIELEGLYWFDMCLGHSDLRTSKMDFLNKKLSKSFLTIKFNKLFEDLKEYLLLGNDSDAYVSSISAENRYEASEIEKITISSDNIEFKKLLIDIISKAKEDVKYIENKKALEISINPEILEDIEISDKCLEECVSSKENGSLLKKIIKSNGKLHRFRFGDKKDIICKIRDYDTILEKSKSNTSKSEKTLALKNFMSNRLKDYTNDYKNKLRTREEDNRIKQIIG